MSDDSSWVKWVLGGLAVAGAAAVGWVRQEDKDGRAALWGAVNADRQADADRRVDAERRFATQADLAALRTHVDGKFDAQTKQITDAILNRPPVKNGGG